VRIVYATRLFSGLESSFINRKWNPTGVPTIYRIIEELDKNHDVIFIFTAKDSGLGYRSTWEESKDFNGSIEGLTHKFRILTGVRLFPSWFPRKLAMILRDFRQSILIFIQAILFKPDIVYCDHANVMAATFISRFMRRTPVLFRVMGVYPFTKQTLKPRSLVHYFYRWAYYSPFSNVICTQDGSGIEEWLKKGLNPETQVDILLNGTDPIHLPKTIDSQLLNLTNNNPIILYVGKLEVYKGCYDFLDAILYLLESGERGFHALIIGTGNKEEELKELVSRKNYSRMFTFIKRLPHKQIYVAHHLSEIYVSMNKLGNLSNSNLEAIRANDCMIIPDPQPDTGVDVVTKKLLGDSVVTVPIGHPKKLSEEIIRLLRSKEARENMTILLNEKKNKFLWTWDERIDSELELLERMSIKGTK
jgi:glycosyltransferase involved in cell wall biosynthesis